MKVSSKYQIAVPASARKQLGIESGDFLIVDVREGSVLLIPEPRSHSRELRGLYREIWQDVDPVEYVNNLRESKDE
ncbi:MAG TPA: AbrB/MazE/SpoVT family DNA-binding domain-containing protein [Thermomicrobiales bacterium]|nr:AbrB/MazE/SpoVT family DNA-binding domain-containing protein [Thermomicrobiales bacterium]